MECKKEVNGLLTASDRANFIKNNPSSMYTGVNSDGEDVFVFLEQNVGMVVKTAHAAKPNVLECIGYNREGEQEEIFYEH